MRTIRVFVILSWFVFQTFISIAGGKGHKIDITVHGMRDSTCFLYHHYGDKQRAVDTAVFDQKGHVVFQGDDELSGGIYIVYVPDKVYFEIIVSEQRFSIETDTGDYVGSMKVTGSIENQVFNSFQKYRKTQYELNTSLKKRLDINKDNADSSKAIKLEMTRLNKESEEYTQGILDKYPDALFAKVLKMTKPIDIPEAPRDSSGNIIDSSFALRYHQKHYFDNVDFADDRILRTPVYQQKIDDYLKLLTHPHPDSINKSIDIIMKGAMQNDEIFRYTLATLYNKYNASKVMGHDAVFLHIAEQFYMSGLAYWADSAFVADISKRVREIAPTLIGEVSKNITLEDTLGRRIPLHSVKADYTIIFFYDSDCGHCKKATPKVKKLYEELKQYKVEVYAVNTKSDVKEWKEFIRKFDLKWINVADPKHHSNFRDFYDVRSTPTMFLLDKDKKIMAKRLGPEQMREVLYRELNLEFVTDPDAEKEEKEKENKEDKGH